MKINNAIAWIFTALMTLVMFSALSAEANDHAVYAQLSSSENQYGNAIVLMDQVDAIQGMEYSQEVGLTVQTPGVYLIIAAPQVSTGKGCYDLWLNVNGEQVANSNVRYCSQVPKQTDVIISQGAACFMEGDIINPVQSGIGIEAIQPPNEPLIPSIIFTAYRIGSC